MTPRDDHDDGSMSFGDHLEELRRRILLAFAPALPLAIILYFFSDSFLRVIVLPLMEVLARQGQAPRVQNLSPPELLIVKLKLSFILAAVAIGPWILWQAWLFVRPGLYVQERRFVRFLVPGSAILTAAGVALLYFVMMPLVLTVLVAVGTTIDLGPSQVQRDARVAELLASRETPIRLAAALPEEPAAGELILKVPEMVLWAAVPDGRGAFELLEVQPALEPQVEQVYRVSTYVNFILMLLVGIVIAFQMPLVIVLLGWLGLASPEWLAANRRWALFIIAILSAVLTPADVVSMLVMLVPLYGLYELGILLLRIAPASAVAAGRPRWRWGRTDKRAGQPIEPAQAERTIARSSAQTRDDDDAPPPATDGGSDR